MSNGGFVFFIVFGLICAGYIFPVAYAALAIWLIYRVNRWCKRTFGRPETCQVPEVVRATPIEEILAEIRYGKRHEDDFWRETKEEKEKRESSA